MASDCHDYSITWKYIVDMMEKKYNFPPDSEKEEAMGRFIHLLDRIWDDFYKERNEKLGRQ